MTETFRPLTIGEQFFEKPILVNVPYSIMPENLPDMSTAPIETIAAPDLSGNHFQEKSFFIKAGQFITKNRWLILGAVCVGGGLYYYFNQNDKSLKKVSATNYTDTLTV